MTTTTRDAVLAVGRQAAVASRRADGDACRSRVLRVIDSMKRHNELLSDAEILRRANVNTQYMQRHKDLKIISARIRSEIVDSGLDQAALRRAEVEVALEVENAMLTRQNHKLSKEVETLVGALKSARAELLASGTTGARPEADATSQRVSQLEAEADRWEGDLRQLELENASLRNLNRRLLLENTRLLQPPKEEAL